MKNFVFILTSWANPSNVTRCLQFVRIAGNKGHNVLLFMVDDGVYASTHLLENVSCMTGDKAIEHFNALKYLKNVTIKICKPCANARNIDITDGLPGITFGSGPELIDAMADATVVTL